MHAENVKRHIKFYDFVLTKDLIGQKKYINTVLFVWLMYRQAKTAI